MALLSALGALGARPEVDREARAPAGDEAPDVSAAREALVAQGILDAAPGDEIRREPVPISDPMGSHASL